MIRNTQVLGRRGLIDLMTLYCQLDMIHSNQLDLVAQLVERLTRQTKVTSFIPTVVKLIFQPAWMDHTQSNNSTYLLHLNTYAPPSLILYTYSALSLLYK